MIGKLLGGILGLMSGGWLGALLGVYIGHWLDRSFLGGNLSGGILGGRNADQDAILTHCFELLGAVCKADGVVTQVEIDAAESLLRKLRIEGDRRQVMIRAFNRGKAADFDVDAATASLRRLCRGRMLWMRLALEIVLTGALADGKLESAEQAMLRRIATGLGMRPADFDALLGLMTGGARGAWAGAQGGGHSAPPSRDRLQEAYAALGVKAEDSDADVRKAYRRLMSQHHPDKLAARDLPEALKAQAEERVRHIRSAWDLIKDARGL